MNAGGVLSHLGTMPVADFVARYWQRRALCIRQAVAGFTNPVDETQLRALAADPQIESRLVRQRAGRWELRHGPFAPRQIPSRRQADWTLLVQGVDLQVAAVAALAARFGFLPAARFDDVMISLAGDGGGVGPHVDQYDVFLLQAQGRRRWRIARQFNPALVEGAPLRVLSDFQSQQEWVLEPGDALYLPPGVAHEGVALGECITISVGFRLPAWQEIIETWHDRQARSDARTGRLHDATRRPTRDPARVPAAMIDAVHSQLHRMPRTRREAACALLENLSEPKPTVVFDAPARPLTSARFAQAALRRGIVLDLRSRLLFAERNFAINGEVMTVERELRAALRHLANHRSLPGLALQTHAAASRGALLPLLYDWYGCGWLHLAA